MKGKRVWRRINRGVLLALLLILALAIQLLVSYTRMSKYEEDIQPFLEDYLNAYAQQTLTQPADQTIVTDIDYNTAWAQKQALIDAEYQERLYNSLQEYWVFFDADDNMIASSMSGSGINLKDLASMANYNRENGYLSARTISDVNVEDVKFEAKNLALVTFTYTDTYTYTGSITLDDLRGYGGSDYDSSWENAEYDENGEEVVPDENEPMKSATSSEMNYMTAYLQYTDDGWKLVSF